MRNMIKSEEEVRAFLNRFFPKFDVWGILYINREKNLEALKMLGITSAMRDSVIRSLDTKDYVETINTLMLQGDNELWVFGKDYDGTELYIKIAIGAPNDKTICISFHLAEHSIDYAYK